MKQRRLLELAAYSLGICIAAAIPLCWRLRWIWEAEGYDGIESKPFALWLPMAFIAAIASYVIVLASLAPKRLFVGTSILLFGMTALLAVMYPIFNNVGSVIAQMATPFVIQLVAFGFLLGGARLLRFRLVNIRPENKLPTMNEWRYAVSDLLWLSTALAMFLAMVQQYDFFWHTGGNSQFQVFLWLKGLCLCVSSLATIWASLSKRWLWWALLALILSPVGILAGWYAQRSLLYPPHWYGAFTAMHAGMLMILLVVLRVHQYQLLRVPVSIAHESVAPAQVKSA